MTDSRIITLLFLTVVLTLSQGQFHNDLCSGKTSGRYVHPADCSKYVSCDLGSGTVRSCPGKLRFNQQLQVCDYSSNVDCKQQQLSVNSNVLNNMNNIMYQEDGDTNHQISYSSNSKTLADFETHVIEYEEVKQTSESYDGRISDINYNQITNRFDDGYSNTITDNKLAVEYISVIQETTKSETNETETDKDYSNDAIQNATNVDGGRIQGDTNVDGGRIQGDTNVAVVSGMLEFIHSSSPTTGYNSKTTNDAEFGTRYKHEQRKTKPSKSKKALSKMFTKYKDEFKAKFTTKHSSPLTDKYEYPSSEEISLDGFFASIEKELYGKGDRVAYPHGVPEDFGYVHEVIGTKQDDAHGRGYLPTQFEAHTTPSTSGDGYGPEFLSDEMSLCQGRPDGMYHSPNDCRQYVVCSNRFAIVKTCPQGLLFNRRHGICDFDFNSDCNQNLHKASRPQPSPTHFGDPGPRTQKPYFKNERSESSLPPGSPRSETPVEVTVRQETKQPATRLPRPKLNSNRMVDTVHVDVPDASKVKMISPKKPMRSMRDVECVHNGMFAHPRDCEKYVRCVSGQAFYNSCPSGTYFDPKYKHCGYSDEACNDLMHRNEDYEYYEDYDSSEEEHDSSEENEDKQELMSKVKDAMTGAMQEAKKKLSEMMKEEAEKARFFTYSRGAFSGVQSFLGSTSFVKQMSLPAEQQLMALQILKERFNLDKDQVKDVMDNVGDPLRDSRVEVQPDMGNIQPAFDMCPYPSNTEENRCDRWAKYRSSDGSCNNLYKPLWGKSFRALARFIYPDYADGINEARRCRNGEKLPSARQVSWELHKDQDAPSHVHTIMMMTFGQILDHDMTRTAVTKLTKDPSGGEMVDVKCGDTGCETEGVENRACLPIKVPDSDPDFGRKQCLMFVRTQEVLQDDCHPSPREQLNQLTSYLDAGHVYGSTKTQADNLRDKSDPKRGKLKVSPNPISSHYLPLLPQKDVKDCRDTNSTIKCFNAGDGRVNEQVGLIALHTAYHRYHNSLEEKLHDLNPHWDGERLYQECRKIIGAIWQFQVYDEYLPLVLGPHKMQEFGLSLAKSGFYDVYDRTVNPDSTNSFATAAFRFAHSNIDGLIKFSGQDFAEFETEDLSKVLRRPYEIYNHGRPGGSGVDAILMGQISHPQQNTDRFFSKQVSVKMFSENPPNQPGTDLPSININRGRDHGLPGYNEWREWCGLPRVTSFDTLYDLPPDVRQTFKKLYRDVDDIDLYAAGVSERNVPGGVVGPTFACIIGQQFRRTRVGDRFWFERDDPSTGFTKEQLAEIRRVPLSRIICDTCDMVISIQKYVMLQPMSEAFKNMGRENYFEAYSLANLYRGEENERRPCSEIPDLDITKWQD